MKRLIKDAEVFSSVGEKVGMLERVVIDPETMEVSHIIVKEGIIFSNSKVIPISYVNLDGERITLTKNAMELDELPDYEAESFVHLDQKGEPEETVESVYWYPPYHLSWWSAGGRFWYPKPKFVRTEKVIPEGTVALKEGAKVISKDDEHIGNLDRVLVDDAEKRATHIVIGAGTLTKQYKIVPTFWVKHATDEKVYLTIASDFFEQLPEYEPNP